MSQGEPAPGGRSAGRRRDLDVLRVFIVFGLIFFHSIRPFDALEWGEGVKNVPASLFATALVVFFSVWGMPILFLISGFGIWHSLSKRTPLAFLGERVKRLLVPLVFGLLVIVPPQMYFHVKQTDPAAVLPYGQYLLRYFRVRLCDDPFYVLCAAGEPEWYGTAHLWFLQYLLIMTVVLLPLFLLLRWRGGGRVGPAGTWLTSLLSHPAAIVLLAAPVILVEMFFGSSMSGGWNRGSYGLFLFYGFLMAADRGVARAMGRAWLAMLIIAIVATLGYLAGGMMLGAAGVDPNESMELAPMAWRAAKGLTGWAWLVVIVGFGARPRRAQPQNPGRPEAAAAPGHGGNRGEQLLVYAGEAFLPVYILHQTIIVVVGYYVVQWQVAAILKYLAISLSTLASALLLYEFAIRRTRVTRWLFGMKAPGLSPGGSHEH